ncbi:hypothetical protein WOLCODRAFT_163856 [Wolfiporia cocos MD-104 SS10]|uniref:Fork-head domain-containing protein n=1 Tax=Wolfiporia cocos (strain MD-104) TaxID=742152 RepID=A0A2H3K0J7_WOLCO|nr:hypothetical protein WOLCODRAFT_163856 [Wolfiporia cocos MD-104 SS10]
MDTNAASGRSRAFSTNYSDTIPTSGDLTGLHYRRHSTGSDSGSSSNGSGREQPARVQPLFATPPVQFGTETNPYAPTTTDATSGATIYVDDAPYAPPGQSAPSQGLQFPPANAYQAAFFGYPPQLLPPATPVSSQPVNQTLNSGGSSPASSIHSYRSDHSGRVSTGTQRSASAGGAEQYSSPNSQFDASFQAPQEQVAQDAPFDAERYPAYDARARRIGLEHVRHNAQPQNSPTGQSYYRPRTLTYPPHVPGAAQAMSMTLDASNTPEITYYAHQQTGPVPLPPATPTPQIDQPPRPLTLADHPIRYQGLPPARVPNPPPLEPLPADIPDPTPNLRQLLGLGPEEEVNLWSLLDPPPGEKPNYPYPTLIKLAIHGSPKKRLTLQEIYGALEERFEWYRNNTHDKAWQNSIRHNLSLNKCFRKLPKPITEPGKGSFWVVDYSQGEGNKRQRKRNKRPTKAELARRPGTSHRGREQSSSDDEQGTSAQSQTGGTPGAQTPPAAAYPPQLMAIPMATDDNIDPSLRSQGAVVGQRITRSATRRGRRIEEPIPRFVPQPISQELLQAPGVPIRPAPVAPGQPAFAAAALEQTQFNQWQATFGTDTQDTRIPPSAWPASAPPPQQQTGRQQSAARRGGRRSRQTPAQQQTTEVRNMPTYPSPPHITNASGVVVAHHVGQGTPASGPAAVQQYAAGPSVAPGPMYGQENSPGSMYGQGNSPSNGSSSSSGYD